jgi:hypothetical protein
VKIRFFRVCSFKSNLCTATASFASFPLRITRDAPTRAPDERVSALDLTMALRRSVATDENVAFWLQRDALMPTFYAPQEEGEGGGVVAARAQSHHLARLTAGARRGEVLSAPPAPPRALAAAALAAAALGAEAAATAEAAAAAATAADDSPDSPSSADVDQWAVAAADAILRGAFTRAGAVDTLEQPPPPAEMAKPKTLLQPPLETLTLEQKLKRWGAPYAGSSLLGKPEEKLPTSGVNQPAPFYRWDQYEGADPNKNLKLGFHPELPARLMAQEAAYRETAAACLAQAARVEAWNGGRGRGGRLAFGDGAAAEAAIAVAHFRAGAQRKEAAAAGDVGFGAESPRGGASALPPFTRGFGGAFVILAAGLTEAQLTVGLYEYKLNSVDPFLEKPLV